MKRLGRVFRLISRRSCSQAGQAFKKSVTGKKRLYFLHCFIPAAALNNELKPNGQRCRLLVLCRASSTRAMADNLKLTGQCFLFTYHPLLSYGHNPCITYCLQRHESSSTAVNLQQHGGINSSCCAAFLFTFSMICASFLLTVFIFAR